MFRRWGKGSKTKNKGNSTRKSGQTSLGKGKNRTKTTLMGDLAQNQSPTKEKRQQLMDRLDEDERNRITIVSEQPIESGNSRPIGKRKESKKRYRSKKNEKAIKEEYEKDYVWVRKELEGYAPLRSLDIWNKIRTSIKYLDEKKGKTARREAEAARLQNMRQIRIESEMKKKITDYTEDILEGRTLTQELEVTCKPEHVDILKTVLNQEYFTMFDISVVETNPNLKRYGINPPILINISRKGVNR